MVAATTNHMAIIPFLFHKFSKAIASKNLFLTRSLSYRKKPQALPTNLDYIRYATLGLCYEEIMSKKIDGNLAEVGVFRGDFAKRMNHLFPQRRLYLFDTFEGFDEKDIAIERTKGYSSGSQDFSSTNIELVRNRMPYPNNCIFKPGYFPESAEGLEEKFCLVSLDADLFEPIYQGLRFFYPKLEKGGYIFIHDYNNDHYQGAKEAVLRFCAENEVRYVPIPDSGGTVIITK